MAIPESTDSTPGWSVASLLQATPRGADLWRAFERSRTQVFELSRAEQMAFFGLQDGSVNAWQYALALGALEGAVEERGRAWDALARLADDLGTSDALATLLQGAHVVKGRAKIHHEVRTSASEVVDMRQAAGRVARRRARRRAETGWVAIWLPLFAAYVALALVIADRLHGLGFSR